MPHSSITQQGPVRWVEYSMQTKIQMTMAEETVVSTYKRHHTVMESPKATGNRELYNINLR